MSVTMNGSDNNVHSNDDNGCAGHSNDSIANDNGSHGNQDRAKRRGCARQLSSVPGDKYLCQKDSKTLEICRLHPLNYTADQDLNSVESYNGESSSVELESESKDSRNVCTCPGNSDNCREDMDGDISPDSPDMVFTRSDQDPTDPGWEFRSTCPVTSWGHFSKSRKEHYKYRRSDYSSDSEEDAAIKIPMQPTAPVDVDSTLRSHLPMCDLTLSPLLNVSVKKKETIPNGNPRITCRSKDGVKPTVFKEKLAVSIGSLLSYINLKLKVLILPCHPIRSPCLVL